MTTISQDTAMTKKRDVDIAILGAGTSGIKAYQEAKKRGAKAVIIHHGPKGTACARVGCMPSKMLVHAAHMANQGKEMEFCGIRIGEAIVNIPTVLRYVRDTRDWFVSHVLESMEEMGDDLILGKPRFIQPDLLEVNGERIRAKATIIATGSHPFIPEPLRKFQDRILISNTLFEQEDLPKRIGVIGMGPMGAELSQALARLGIEITAVQRGETVGMLTDPRIIDTAVKILRHDMALWMNARAEVQEGENGNLILRAGGKQAEVDKLLVCVGRRPNLDDLGLEEIGVTMKDGKPEVDENTLQVKDFPIYLAGDVNGIRPILHEATFEGRAALAHALGEKEESERQVNMGIIFIHPQIAFVGRQWKQLAEDKITVGEYSFTHQARARIEGRNQGLMRLYADKQNGRLIGAEMIAPDAEHLAHWLALAIGQRMTVQQLLRQPFYHPVIEESLRSALAQVT